MAIPGNLLPDAASDFEDPDSVDYWMLFGDGGRDTTIAHSGTASLRIATDPDGFPIFAVRDQPGVQPETEYVAYAWAYTQASDIEVYLAFNWWNAGDEFIGDDVGDPVILTPGVWTQISVPVTSPAGTASTTIWLVASGSGADVWFDDIFFGADEGPGESITGTLAGILPALTGTAEGEASTTATLTGTLPALTGSATVEVAAEGALSGILPALTGQLDAEAHTAAAIDATLPAPTGGLEGVIETPGGMLIARLPALAGEVTAQASTTAGLDATLPAIGGALAADATATGELAGTLPAVESAASGSGTAASTLDAILPAPTGQATGAAATGGRLDGELPAAVAELAARVPAVAELAAQLPAVAGALEGASHAGGPGHLVVTLTAAAHSITTREPGLVVTLAP